MANSLFASYDKFGPAATLLTGSLGKIRDTDLVWTQFCRTVRLVGPFTGSGTTNIMPYASQDFATTSRRRAGDVGRGAPRGGARYIGFKRRSCQAVVPLDREAASVIVNL